MEEQSSQQADGRMALSSEYVQIIGQAPPAGVTSPLPVAWLEGDVLAEYVRFLKEVEEAATVNVTGPGAVKWLEGDVLAEFLQFLGEDKSVVQYGSSNGRNSYDDDLMDDEKEEDDDDEEMEHLLQHIMSLPAFMTRVAATSVQD
jgi:hypothetical protein